MPVQNTLYMPWFQVVNPDRLYKVLNPRDLHQHENEDHKRCAVCYDDFAITSYSESFTGFGTAHEHSTPLKQAILAQDPNANLESVVQSEFMNTLINGWNRMGKANVSTHQRKESQPTEASFPVSLACGHIFCHDCISKWTTASKTCPCCRQVAEDHQVHEQRKRQEETEVQRQVTGEAVSASSDNDHDTDEMDLTGDVVSAPSQEQDNDYDPDEMEL